MVEARWPVFFAWPFFFGTNDARFCSFLTRVSAIQFLLHFNDSGTATYVLTRIHKLTRRRRVESINRRRLRMPLIGSTEQPRLRCWYHIVGDAPQLQFKGLHAIRDTRSIYMAARRTGHRQHTLYMMVRWHTYCCATSYRKPKLCLA